GTKFANVYATNLTGTLQTAAQANVTSLGTLTSLTVGGGISASTNNTYDIGASGTKFANVYSTNLYGTLQTAAQANVTSLGTLTELTSGAIHTVADGPSLYMAPSTANKSNYIQFAISNGGTGRGYIGFGNDGSDTYFRMFSNDVILLNSTTGVQMTG